MNNEEIQALMSQLKDAGLTPEDIADGILWPLFRDGKMSKEDLSTLCASIGLELDEEFDKDSTPAPIEDKGGDDKEVAPSVTKEEAEEAKEIKPGESKEEFENKIEESVETPASEGEDKADDEEAEWEEAKKLFKL